LFSRGSGLSLYAATCQLPQLVNGITSTRSECPELGLSIIRLVLDFGTQHIMGFSHGWTLGSFLSIEEMKLGPFASQGGWIGVDVEGWSGGYDGWS
jgi:hypothetical protein